MSIFRKVSCIFLPLLAATLLSGCAAGQKVADFTHKINPFSDDTAEATVEADPAATEAPLAPVAETPAEAVETAPAITETLPTPMEMEPVAAKPIMEQPVPIMEQPAAALPLVESVTFVDEMTPEQAAATAPAPTEIATYEVLVPDGDYTFLPRQLTIYAGDSVDWKNQSGVVHLFASIPGSDASGKMEIDPVDLGVDASYTHTFGTAGTFPYFCFIHNRMTGKVVVLPR